MVVGRLVLVGFDPMGNVGVGRHSGPKNYAHVVGRNELFRAMVLLSAMG